jgi:hypothetical protein
MATTVERRRSSLTNAPIARARLGYQAGDARISVTAEAKVSLIT